MSVMTLIGTIAALRGRLPGLLILLGALVICVLAAPSGAVAQATDTIQGVAPPGGLGFGIPGIAIDGDVGANTGTFQFPPAGLGTHSPDSLSDWGIGVAGKGINLVTNTGSRNASLAGNPNVLLDTVATDVYNGPD